MKTNKILFLLIFVINAFFCNAQNNNIEFNVNNYRISKKSFYGKLKSKELRQIRDSISKELNIQFPNKKTVVIHYYQNSPNCYPFYLSDIVGEGIIDSDIYSASELSKKYNTLDFFVYSENSLIKEKLEKRTNFIKDSHFFSKNIFTLQENCVGFFILKTNGEFMIHYGGDYIIQSYDFFRKKIKNKRKTE